MSQIITIRAKANGLDCWHKIRLAPNKEPLLARLKGGEAIDVTQLGEVLESGWGAPTVTEIDYDKA